MYLLPTASSMKGLPSWYGVMTSAAQWGDRPIREGRPWALDNGVFTGAFDEAAFLQALDAKREHQGSCLFVAAPDVLGDAASTLDAWREWRPLIEGKGYRAAFVLQDGMTPSTLPEDATAVFLGGSTGWKMSDDALDLLAGAKATGAWVHVGRVNSQRRIRRFTLAGANSCDGTYVRFAGVRRTVAALDLALAEEPLWRGAV
jgi:hypothetical protein